MKRNIPVEKNKDYIIDITGMGHSGEGVGKIQDFTVFVPEALIGEEVKVKIVKVNKNFAFGKLIDITKPSPDRIMPACGIYKRCGGCQIQHLSYNAQLQFKKQRVIDAITRIGKLKDVEVLSPLGMENPFRYRNKVQLPVRERDGKVVIGFFAERSHDIIDMEVCNIQDEAADKAADVTRKWMEKHKVPAYNEETGKGIVRHIMVRRGFTTGEVMVVLITNTRELPHRDEFIEEIKKNIEGIKSIIQNINTKQTNIIMGLENITLWGEAVITDFIGDFKFNISPLSFFQVNPVQTEVLYGKALEYAELTGNEVVFDAYCGAGTISLFLAQKAKKVYGVEIVPEAIEDANNNARVNNVDNVEFIVGESEKVIPELIDKGIIADVVVVDPPRKGCEESLLHAIAGINPKRIVYVSCDPGTLARDLGILDGLGYKTVKVQPVDMFPQTSHVETVVLMSRKDK